MLSCIWNVESILDNSSNQESFKDETQMDKNDQDNIIVSHSTIHIQKDHAMLAQSGKGTMIGTLFSCSLARRNVNDLLPANQLRE